MTLNTDKKAKINKELKPTDYVPNGNSPSREAAQTPAPATSKQGVGQGGPGCTA